MAKNQAKNRYIEKEKAKIREKKKFAKTYKHINLGLIVYFLIFAYLIFCVLSFSFSEKTNYTMAEPGIIVEAESFKGLIIKNEVVITSNISGNTNFFVPKGNKVKQGSLVSCIDINGVLTAAIKKELKNKSAINSVEPVNNNNYFQDQMKSYVLSMNGSSFKNIYNEKAKIEKMIFDLSNTFILEDHETLSRLLNSVSSENQTLTAESNLYYAPRSGVISYNFDGFEDINIDNFTPEYLNQVIHYQNAFNETSILKGGQLFKIIDNYKWYLAAEINDVFRKYLENKKTISIYIASKDLDIDGHVYDIITEDGMTTLILEFDRYLNDFLEDRFIDFTVNYINSEGIKIPLSAITTKDFLKVPSEALERLNNRIVIKKKVIDLKAVGGESLKAHEIDIYTIKDGSAYVPLSEALNVGDTIHYILKDGTNSTFTIAETKKVEGVFVINKGYAVFKIIETLSFNDDYKIIKNNTQYGVKEFDRIATDSSSLQENQIIN